MSEIRKKRDNKKYEQRGRGEVGNSSFQLTRRDFLSTLIVAGCSVLVTPAYAYAYATGIPEFKGWPKSYGMLTDITACVGCRSCEKACNEANRMPVPDKPFDDGSVFGVPRFPSAKALTVVNRYENPKDSSKPVYRKIQCNHCLEPACASACPMHAYTKTPESAVIYNPDVCFGCRYCVIACPFNMPGYDYESAFEPKIVKCIFCYGRIKEGKLPACAEACPGGALTFGRRMDILKLARKKILDNPQKYIDHIYGEHEVGGTSWLYISCVPFEQIGFPTNLPKKPLIELTKGYLSSVPVIFTAFPALFSMVYGIMRYNEKAAEKEKGLSQQKEVNNG